MRNVDVGGGDLCGWWSQATVLETLPVGHLASIGLLSADPLHPSQLDGLDD